MERPQSNPICSYKNSAFTSTLLIVLVLGSLGLYGCASTNLPRDGMRILCVPPEDAENFLAKLGYPRNFSAGACRSSSGDRLFVQFDDHVGSYGPEVQYKVAIVSSNGISVKDLPGQSRLTDQGIPVMWTTWTGTAMNPLHFADGYTASNDVYCYWRSDGKYIGFIQDGRGWLARPESPLQKLVLDKEPDPLAMMALQLTVSSEDRLHLFVKGSPEGKERSERPAILKHFEYQVEGNNARLVQVQDFYDASTAQDFDPESGFLLASSWDTPSAHGLLIDTRTGRRKDLPSCHGPSYFVTDAVAKRFREALASN